MQYTENIRLAPDSEFVCWCAKVTKGQILEAHKQEAKTLDDISKMTGACIKGDYKKNNPRGRCCSVEIMQLVSESKLNKSACKCCKCKS